MSRRLPILVLALVLAVGVGVIWKSISGPLPGEEEVALPGPGSEVLALEPEASGELPSAPSAVAPDTTSEREVAVVAPEVPRVDVVSAIPDDSIWVEGRLFFPDKLPLDESFKIVASGRRFGSDRSSPRRHEVEPDPAGLFRDAFAKKTSTGTVGLEARYMYLLAKERGIWFFRVIFATSVMSRP